MNAVRQNIVKASLIIMGIVGYAVLMLPWYELSAHSYISGYGSSSMDGGTQIGLISAYTSYFGYGLYILPAALIGLGLGFIGGQFATRNKAMMMLAGGSLEVICLYLLNNEMKNYATEISGYGYSSSSGFSPISGYYIALTVYAVTAAVGLLMIFVAPNPNKENV